MCLLAAWPLLQPGLISTRAGGDSPFLLVRLFELVDGLRAGEVPVRWMAHAAYGYGYPFFVYYGALPFYLAAAFYGLGWGLVGGLKLVQLLALLTAALGAYKLVWELTEDAWAGALAGVAYTVAPFHLVNLYVRGDSLTEYVALALYPWLLWAAAVLVVAEHRRARLALAAGLALLYGALIATHNISALLFSPFLVLWVFVLGRPLLGLAGLAWGAALAAWYWLPALGESRFVRVQENLTGYFHFGGHFRGLDLVQWQIPFDYSVEAGRHAFAMGGFQTVMGLLALLWAGKRFRGDRPVLLVIASALVATLMITPLSRPLWERLPLLPFVQFPWRLLGPQAVFLAVLSGTLALAVRPSWRPALAVLVGLLLTLEGLGGLRPLRMPVGRVTAGELQTFELVTSNLGSTVRAEYLPQPVEPRPWSSVWLGGKARPLAPEGDLAAGRLLYQSGSRTGWHVEVGEPGARVLFPTYWFPGFEAQVDGRPTQIVPDPGTGWMSLELDQGRHRVELRLGRTRLRLAAELLSLLALTGLAGALAWTWRPGRRGMIGAAGVLLLLGVLGLLLPETWLAGRGGASVFDYDRRPFPHPGPPGLDHSFPARVTAGEALRGELWFEPAGERRLRLVSPAQALQGVPLVAAESVIDGAGAFSLPVPSDSPTGFHLLQLEDQALGWVEIEGRPRGTAPEVARFGPIDLLDVDTRTADGDLWVWLGGAARRPMAENYVVSLRLVGPGGERAASLDQQPGYGFDPTSLWPPEVVRRSRFRLASPPPLEAPVLEVLLYRGADRQPLAPPLRLSLDEAWRPRAIERRFELPPVELPLRADFGDQIRLNGANLSQEANALEVELVWQALTAPKEDWVVFVHLLDEGEAIVSQHDGRPAVGLRPTTTWQAGEIVLDAHLLTLTTVSSGRYRLAVGLYDPATGLRLPLSRGGDRLLLSEPLVIGGP